MKKYIISLILLIATGLSPYITFAQTTVQNQNNACANKVNGQDCTYADTEGKCDRRGGGNAILYCNPDQTGWEDCFNESLVGDRCRDKGADGTCAWRTVNANRGIREIYCNTTGAAPGASPGAAPGAAPGGVAPGTSSSPSTTAGTVSYESYTNFPGVGRIRDLCQLINALWLLGFVVLLTSVLGMFLYGGYLYVTAGVNAGKVNQAKEIFTNTITGLIIGLSIFIVINIINPGLLQGNCSIPSAGSGTPGTPSTPGTPGTPPSNIVPQPGESVFPVTREYQCPGPRTSFGYARGRLHKGVDLTPPLSTISNSQALQLPILAFRDGTVTEIGSGVGAVRIDHGGGLNTRYLHNSRIFVRVGDRVQAGQEIAKMGDVGSPQVIHLHFEVYQNGSPVDPAPIIFDSSKNPDPSKVQTTGSPRCVGQNT